MSNFQEVQNTIANLYNSKVQSKFYKANTKFLEYMATVIKFIVKEREKELNKLVSQFPFINNYIKLKQDINNDIEFIKNIDNVDFGNYSIKKSSFEKKLKELAKLNSKFFQQQAQEIQNHKLMQDFLADTLKNLNTNNYNNYEKQFDDLVIDIQSQLDFYSMTKKYPSIDNFSALKREIQSYKNNNRNYSVLIKILIPVLEEIKKVNNQFYQQSQKIQNHNIMQDYYNDFLKNLDTRNYSLYENKFKTALSRCEADIEYKEGKDYRNYLIFGDGVILEKNSGFYWYSTGNISVNDKDIAKNAEEHIRRLNNINYHNFNDWRLPSINEVNILFNNSNPVILSKLGNIIFTSTSKIGSNWNWSNIQTKLVVFSMLSGFFYWSCVAIMSTDYRFVEFLFALLVATIMLVPVSIFLGIIVTIIIEIIRFFIPKRCFVAKYHFDNKIIYIDNIIILYIFHHLPGLDSDVDENGYIVAVRG